MLLIVGGVLLVGGISGWLIGDSEGVVIFWLGVIMLAMNTAIIISNFRGYRKTIKSWLIEYEKSRLRTSNPQHIENLRKFGYQVSENFVPQEIGIGYIRNIFGDKLKDIDQVWQEVKYEMGNPSPY